MPKYSDFVQQEQVIAVAKTCHEANRVLCEAQGDTSQKPWDEASDWQKGSAMNGVLFNIDNPHAPASASHENWLKEKIAQGWIYGPVKDEEKKEHPCIMNYDDLPANQRIKDAVFKCIVNNSFPLFTDVGIDVHDVVIGYTNHAGVVNPHRLIQPGYIYFGTSPWHKDPQWLLHAYCYEKEAVRTFALAAIQSWSEPEE